MRLPLIVITHGAITKDSKSVYCCSNSDGINILPLFTDAERACDYRKHAIELIKTNFKASFKESGSEPVWVAQTEPDLQFYAVASVEHLSDLLRYGAAVSAVSHVAIDPGTGNQNILCYETDELLEMLSASSVSDPSSG